MQILPGAGVATAGGRINGKLQRSKRARFRAFKAELHSLTKRTAKAKGWKATGDFEISPEDAAAFNLEVAKLRAHWGLEV